MVHPNTATTGLDIGVGASAIYPLIACSINPSWQMFGVDIDSYSLGFALQNVRSNGLEHKVHLRLSSEDQPLIQLKQLGVARLDFVMTNPPFLLFLGRHGALPRDEEEAAIGHLHRCSNRDDM